MNLERERVVIWSLFGHSVVSHGSDGSRVGLHCRLVFPSLLRNEKTSSLYGLLEHRGEERQQEEEREEERQAEEGPPSPQKSLPVFERH